MTPKIPDYGHRDADKKLYALTKRLHMSYRQASVNLGEKLANYLDQFEKEDAMKRALYDSGELSHEEFLKWRQKRIIETRYWRNMLEQLTNDIVNQDKIAASMIKNELPAIYAENHNYGTYEAEVGSGVDTTYTMYDKDTVSRLLRKKQDLLPYPDPSLDIPKDKLWNRQHIQSAVLQGILTGESMKDIAQRFQDVVGMDERSAIRNARTAVTGAENAGRIDSYLRAQAMGIKLKQVWMSGHDNRVRHSHAILDGEKQDPGEKFSNGCRYPGDPEGAPEEIYNCRCTLVAEVEGSDPYDPTARQSELLQNMSYDEWKQMHGEQFFTKLFKEYKEPQSEEITGERVDLTTHRSGYLDKFNELDDYDKAVAFQEGLYINQNELPDKLKVGGESQTQNLVYSWGINDKPTVLSSEDFDKYLKDHNIEDLDIITRSVNAMTEQCLTDWMHDDLNYISGRFGGANFGEGFYFGHNFGKSMNYGGANNKTIRAVIKPDAKILKIEDLREVRDQLPRDYIGEMLNPNNDKDKSVIAILGGYDGIIAPNGYVNIINRSCVIVDETIF